MSISNSKTRIALTIDKDLKEQLSKIAKDEERSLNNLIIKILKDYIKK